MSNKQLNKTAKLSFYNARKREGDVNVLAANTGYSKSHVRNVLAGRRSVPEVLANEMYTISRKRTSTSKKTTSSKKKVSR